MKYNKAIINSINGSFDTYVLENVINVTIADNTVVITWLDKQELRVVSSSYACDNVIISIA